MNEEIVVVILVLGIIAPIGIVIVYSFLVEGTVPKRTRIREVKFADGSSGFYPEIYVLWHWISISSVDCYSFNCKYDSLEFANEELARFIKLQKGKVKESTIIHGDVEPEKEVLCPKCKHSYMQEIGTVLTCRGCEFTCDIG